jgi:hypothetical protein
MEVNIGAEETEDRMVMRRCEGLPTKKSSRREVRAGNDGRSMTGVGVLPYESAKIVITTSPAWEPEKITNLRA